MPSPSGYDKFRNLACTTKTGVQEYTYEEHGQNQWDFIMQELFSTCIQIKKCPHRSLAEGLQEKIHKQWEIKTHTSAVSEQINTQGWMFMISILNSGACLKFLFGESHCQSKEFVTFTTWYFLQVNMIRGLWLGCCSGIWKVIYFFPHLGWVSYLNPEVQLPGKKKAKKIPRLLSCLLAMVKTNGDTKRCAGVERGQLLFLKSSRGRRTHPGALQGQPRLSSLQP